MKNLSNDNVIHKKDGDIQYLQFKKLLEYKSLINHAYSLGLDRNYRTARANKKSLPKEEYEKAINDYKALCNSIEENYINIVKTNQKHTANIKVVTKKINKNEPDFNVEEYLNTDGIITNKKELVLATTNADCILLLLFDPIKKVIANVHSGWKGTLQKISVKAVDKMIEEFGCNCKDIQCYICPSIRKCHFEVEKDVKTMFESEFKNLKQIGDIIEEKIPNKKWNIDTVLINQILLEQRGLKKENIIDSKICSVCNCDLIHSYRVEKQGYGLNTAIISLKG